jgi:cytochrome b subunit of formate dehydrogenase
VFADSPPRSPVTHVKVPRHSLAARLFHWIMAAAMFALFITAFLPRVGVRFPWVTYHWIAGMVLTASIVFHIIHATFYMGLR